MMVYLVELSYSIDEPSSILGIYSTVALAQEKCANYEQQALDFAEFLDFPDDYAYWIARGRDAGQYQITAFEVDAD